MSKRLRHTILHILAFFTVLIGIIWVATLAERHELKVECGVTETIFAFGVMAVGLILYYVAIENKPLKH